MIEYIHNLYVNNEPLILDKEYTIIQFSITNNGFLGVIHLIDKEGNMEVYLVNEFLEMYKEYFRKIKIEKLCKKY